MVFESEQHKIIRQILSGDSRQLELATAALRARSQGIVAKIVRIDGMEEDRNTILNDTVLEIIKSVQRERYDPERSDLDGFIFAIVRNKWMDVLKKRYREKERGDQYANYIRISISSQNPTENSLFSTEQRQLVRTVLKQLKPIDRKIMEMKYLRSISLRVIAERLGKSEEAIKKRHERCKKKLQKILGKDPRIDD